MKKKYIVGISVSIMLLLLFLMNYPTQVSAKDVCATVKIEILQEMTFERQAFEARMKITNGLDGSALENIRIDIDLKNEAGEEKTELFFITLTSKTGLTGDPDGSGTISPGGAAEIYWLLIPAKEAAGDTPLGMRYFAGATLGYTMMGEQSTIIVDPDMIQVLPQPYLKLDYFLPGQVYGDDPFTWETESAIPFNLGVRIHNIGLGAANKLKIDSGQPKIVENVLGLLIDFKIISSSVDDEPAKNSLLIDFGDLESQNCAMGRWQMISTLTGNFIEFDATLTHADYLGGEMTSLVDYNIGTHFLLHDVLIDRPGCDQIRDFLTGDFQSGDLKSDDLKLYPSEPYYDQNSQEIIPKADYLSSSFDYTGSVGADDLCLEMTGTAFATNPYLYLNKKDLTQGNLQIVRVLRCDGKSLPEENYWISQTSPDNGHTWIHYLNIFDTSNDPIYNLSYCLYYEEIIDTTAPCTSVIIGDPKVGTNPDPCTSTNDPIYVNRDTQFTFRADDTSDEGSSGIKGIRLALNDEAENPAPNPFMFSQRMDIDEGPYNLLYRSIDNMDNEEPVNTMAVVLDLTAPVIENVSINPQTIIPGAPPEVVVIREALILLQITDESGFIEVGLDIAQGSSFDNPLRQIKENFSSGLKSITWNGKDANQKILSPGVYNLRIKAADLLGNVTFQDGYSITIASHMGEEPLPAPEEQLPRMKLLTMAPTEASAPLDQINPAIDQSGAIVWQDYRNGNWDIYHCLGSQVTQITDDPAAQENPAVYGQTIVWQDYRKGDWDIYYKIGDNQEVALDLAADQINPAISDNRLVFEESGNIYLHTIGGATEQITDHIRDQIHPAIDQDLIVWQDSRHGDPLIYAYNIATEEETQITPIDEERHTRHIYPCVSGDAILWADNRYAHYDIYHYKISDGSTQRLTYGLLDQTRPRVSGSRFVYMDEGAQGFDIAQGSVLSLISERIVSDEYQQQNPCLAGNGPYTVVWQDNRSGHWRIYRCLIEQDDLRIMLHEGLNLIALAQETLEDLPSSSNPDDPNTSVEFYTKLNQENGIVRLSQYNQAEAIYNTIDEAGGAFIMNPKGAFSLYADQGSIISIPTVGDHGAVDLQAGYNQIGLASMPAGFTAYDLIESLGLAKVKMVQRFTGSDQRFSTINISDEGQPIGSNFPIYPGDGLNIIMRSAVSGWRPSRL